MSSFFGSNPFATPVGQKIEQATHDTLASEDWGLNLEVCDLINSSEESAKDAVRAVRKLFTQSPKNYTTIMYTLTVLESCVKNCGHKFHLLVCTKDFVHELVKLIGPKNDPPTSVQDKVLALIQSWTDAFRHQPELAGVSQVYAELKHKGVVFPSTETDATPPIITPTRSVSPKEGGFNRGVGGAAPRPAMTTSPPLQQQCGPQLPLPTQTPTLQSSAVGGGVAGVGGSDWRGKLVRELGVVEGNAGVLADMLAELTPGQEHPHDLTLLQDLHATCVAMQKRLVDLVARVSDDLLTADLLRLNDLLNNLFIRYDRHMSKSRAKGSPIRSNDPAATAAAIACHRPPPEPPRSPDVVEVAASEVALIDLGDDEPSQPPPALVTLGKPDLACVGMKAEEADFDSFAQSRTATVETAKRDGDAAGSSVTGAGAAGESEQVETNFDSMERWMNSQPYGSEISSDAFQKFLSERASVADTIPSISAATGSTHPPPPAAAAAVAAEEEDGHLGERKKSKDKEKECALYAV